MKAAQKKYCLSGESKVSCHLVPIVKKALWDLKPKGKNYYPPRYAVAIVHTLHVPFKNEGIIWAYRKLNAKLISVSFSQRKPAPNLNYVANIYS